MDELIRAVLDGKAAWALVQADCIDAMRVMPEASVDAVVCDPPYGLREGFRCVGIEREQEYVTIARARIIGDAPLLNRVL